MRDLECAECCTGRRKPEDYSEPLSGPRHERHPCFGDGTHALEMWNIKTWNTPLNSCNKNFDPYYSRFCVEIMCLDNAICIGNINLLVIFKMMEVAFDIIVSGCVK